MSLDYRYPLHGEPFHPSSILHNRTTTPTAISTSQSNIIIQMATAQAPRPARPAARHYLTDTSVPKATDRRPVPVSGSSNMNLNLASNNPFRRAISPNPSGFPLAPAQFRGPPPTNGAVNNENRPPPPRQNTNPFLDNYQVPAYPVAIPSQNAQRSPGKPIQPPSHGMSTSPRKNNFGSNVPVEAMVCCFQCFWQSCLWVETSSFAMH